LMVDPSSPLRPAPQIGGYVDSVAEEATAKGRQAVRQNATRHLHRIQSFISSLANPDKDGRILLSAEPAATPQGTPSRTEVTLKYLLLAPADAFREIAEEARSVVLAGGTMAPMSDFKEQVFPYLSPDRFTTFSCGHVVPDEHVATFAVAKGPGGRRFEFTFEARKDEKLVSGGPLAAALGACVADTRFFMVRIQHDELGQAVINICQVVPKGVVVFCPSYEFLWQVQARWDKTGAIARLGQRKKVRGESKVDVELRGTWLGARWRLTQGGLWGYVRRCSGSPS